MSYNRTNDKKPQKQTPWCHTTLAYVLGASIVSGGSVFALQENTKRALHEQFTQEKVKLQQEKQQLQERNAQLYKQNALFHVKGFNQRLTEKGIRIYS